jgi:hypothetical protein
MTILINNYLFKTTPTERSCYAMGLASISFLFAINNPLLRWVAQDKYEFAFESKLSALRNKNVLQPP